jgi:predicted metal-dependent RNase
MFITESKASNHGLITRYAVEKKFKSCLLNTIKLGRNVFIPADSANISLEIVIIIEKILSEYYLKAKEENLQVLPYRILFCNYCSSEIIEDVKTQIEWMCSEISKQFYNFNENPFSFQYLACVNDLSQFNEMKKGNHIIVASSESLDVGFSNVRRVE